MEPIDSSTPLGLALLRILVALAGLESTTTGIRVQAYKRASAERGEPPAAKAYGLTQGWDAIVEEEAAVIREAAQRAMSGERLATIARDLRTRGVPSPTGGLWTDATLGRILRNRRLVGDRAYRGEVVARSCFAAVLDDETFDLLQLTLAHPERHGAPARHHRRLATGFAVCGLCGQRMSTTTRGGIRYYSCPTVPTGCGRIHVNADGLEGWLLDRLLERLRAEDGPSTQEAACVAETAQALRQLAHDFYVARLIGREEFLSVRAVLVRRAEASSQSQGRKPDVARLLGTADPRRALGELDLGRLRELLADRLDRVVVSRFVSVRRGVFDSGRLRCQWRNAVPS